MDFKRVFFLAIGIVLLIIGIGTGYTTYRFTQVALSAEGTVVALNAGQAHPQIEFTTQDGTKVTYPQGGWVFYNVGDKVPVLYDKDHPQQTACINTFGGLYFAPVLVTLMGVMFVVFTA